MENTKILGQTKSRLLFCVGDEGIDIEGFALDHDECYDVSPLDMILLGLSSLEGRSLAPNQTGRTLAS